MCSIPRKDALSKILRVKYTFDLKKNMEKLSVFIFDIFEKKFEETEKNRNFNKIVERFFENTTGKF